MRNLALHSTSTRSKLFRAFLSLFDTPRVIRQKNVEVKILSNPNEFTSFYSLKVDLLNSSGGKQNFEQDS